MVERVNDDISAISERRLHFYQMDNTETFAKNNAVFNSTPLVCCRERFKTPRGKKKKDNLSLS